MTRPYKKEPKAQKYTETHSGAYVKPGIEQDFLLKMQRPIRSEAIALMDKVYGDLPQPSEGRFLGYLIALGSQTLMKQFGQSGAPAPKR